MGEITKIEWADSTANLWIGCTKVSAACDHCYAETLMGSGEHDRMKRVVWGPHGKRSRCAQGWRDIRRWQRQAASNRGVDPKLGRRRWVFVNSLSDFFDNHPSVVWRDDAWELIRQCPDLIFILVTKRPQNIVRMAPSFWREIADRVILMTTVEDQTEADRRIPALIMAASEIGAPACLALSCEPLLGTLDIGWALGDRLGIAAGILSRGHFSPGLETLRGIGWVIAGGESGREARPMHPYWPLMLAVQCESAGVPFFFKQWGEWAPGRGPEERMIVPTLADAFEVPYPSNGVWVAKIGKASAGRTLAERIFDARPQLA